MRVITKTRVTYNYIEFLHCLNLVLVPKPAGYADRSNCYELQATPYVDVDVDRFSLSASTDEHRLSAEGFQHRLRAKCLKHTNPHLGILRGDQWPVRQRTTSCLYHTVVKKSPKAFFIPTAAFYNPLISIIRSYKTTSSICIFYWHNTNTCLFIPTTMYLPTLSPSFQAISYDYNSLFISLYNISIKLNHYVVCIESKVNQLCDNNI